jgi:hypothetical protein
MLCYPVLEKWHQYTVWQVHRDPSLRNLGSAMTWLCQLVAISLWKGRRSALLDVTTWLSHCLLQCDDDARYFTKRVARIESHISGAVTSFHSFRSPCLVCPPNKVG